MAMTEQEAHYQVRRAPKALVWLAFGLSAALVLAVIAWWAMETVSLPRIPIVTASAPVLGLGKSFLMATAGTQRSVLSLVEAGKSWTGQIPHLW